MRFHEAVRARHDHRADGVRPHDMGIIVDLDPARRAGEAESLGERGEELRLRGGLGQFASQRLAGILPGVFDEIPFFALSRHGDLDSVAGAFAQGLREHAAILDFVGKQNQARRRLVRVKLREKGIEDLARREALVGARKIGAIAPILIGPEKKRLRRRTVRLVRRWRRHPPLRRFWG